MRPTIKLATKTDLYQFLWLMTVTGFDQRHHCMKCLKGKQSDLVKHVSPRFPAGFVAEGEIEQPEPFVYLCGVSHFSRYYDQHLHVLMVRDEGAAFTHEDANICVLVTGMRRLPIPELPPEAVSLPDSYRTCRNFQAGWHLFPAERKPFVAPSAAE